MNRDCSKAAVIFAVLVLTACSQAPQPSATEAKTGPETKEAAGPPVPVSAKTAFWEMYKLAHSWTTDILPLSLVSKEVPGVENGDGKAGMWTATFVSPSRHEARVFSYSVVSVAPDVFKGVNANRPVPWSGPTRQAMPFRTADFTVDSDAAYKTALAKAETWVKEHPGKKASLSLGNAARFPAPVWYVLWGDNKSGYFALVNATTGNLVNGK
ncbi:MAG TPA: hypothetical protein VKV15_08260 [Bryobacteraceae bacterium]|nr:hypothetical protein [Bryobacteraceae bacterium]